MQNVFANRHLRMYDENMPYVTIRSHHCPHCMHKYWTNNTTLLICGSPERVCPQCGTHFIDDDLYVEWDDMTDKQKRFWIHWHGSDVRKMLNIFSWILSPFAFLLAICVSIIWFSSNDYLETKLAITIAAAIVIPLFLFLFFFSRRDYHSMKNYLKDEAVRESIKRTRGIDFTNKVVFDSKPVIEPEKDD